MHSFNPGARARCRRLLAAMTVITATYGSASFAGTPPNITDTETALLPPYCRDTQMWPGGTGDAGMIRGKAKFGEMFWHFHHYCYAMIYLMRADRSANSAMDRRGFLASALDDIEYVVKYLPPDHFMLPEMYTQEGKVMRRQERYNDAVNVLRKATSRDPSYWRAFFELALCYEAMEDRNAALEALREGLRHSPDSKGLSAYLRELELHPKGKAAPAKVASDQSGKRRSSQQP